MAPDTYKGVPVPPRLRQYWSKPTGRWWRMGVDAAQGAVAEAKERHAEAMRLRADLSYLHGVIDRLQHDKDLSDRAGSGYLSTIERVGAVLDKWYGTSDASALSAEIRDALEGEV